ncbi:WxL domain-containing protein [Enterococcus sp. LJL120]
MKKKVLGGLAVVSLLTLAGGVNASAAAAGSTTTNGFVEFNADTSGGGGGTTEPGDPGDGDGGSEVPVDPGNPGGGDGGSTTGALRLAYVPDFDFGSHTISYSSAGNTYYAKYQTVTEQDASGANTTVTHTRPSFFVVRDLRGGTQGWNVTVSNNQKLTNATNSADQLNVVFSIQNMFVTNTEGFSTSAITLANTGTSAYTDLTSSATTLVSAPSGSGAGSYNVLLGSYANKNTDETNPGVKLFIPANQVISSGKYETTLNWAINDTL